MKRLTTAALAASCLIGSGGLADESAKSVRSYVLPQAAGMPMEQLARVVAVMGPKSTDSTFVALFDATRKEIRLRRFPPVSVTATQLTLTPGKYSFTVSCNQFLDLRYLPVSMSLAAGRTYSIWCEPVPWSAPMIRFKDQSHSDWDGPHGEPAPASF